MSLPATYFEAMYQRSDDPWSFRTRWYEQRKREVLLASLPRARFGFAFEPGCSNGELTVELAPRCDRLLATDSARQAVELARARTARHGNVTVTQASLPEGWPEGEVDLAVLSEVAYYLDRESLGVLARRVRSSLGHDGVVVGCHWRHSVTDYPLGGDEVHALLAHELHLHRLASHVEADFLLDVWSVDARSVAAREGLR